MNNKKVSACVITYNQEKYIRECLDGIVNQVVDFEYEVVIGEDCSSDSTLSICREYAEKYPNLVRLLPREANLGMSGNWQATIQNCQGTYIALCEGDDFWTDPLKLQRQVDFLEANQDYVLCFHKVSILTTEGVLVDDFITKLPDDYESLESLIHHNNYIHTPSVVFRNIPLNFPPQFKLSPIVDYFLYILLAEHGKLKCLEENMAVYRYGVGVLSELSLIEKIKNSTRLYSFIIAYLQDDRLKKLLIDKQSKDIVLYFKIMNGKYNDYFISNHVFFKTLKFIKGHYKNPARLFSKLISKTIK